MIITMQGSYLCVDARSQVARQFFCKGPFRGFESHQALHFSLFGGCGETVNTASFKLAISRGSNGFSKKWENNWAALAMHFAFYNFCRIHKSIRVTPAMEAKLTDRIWTIAEILSTQE